MYRSFIGVLIFFTVTTLPGVTSLSGVTAEAKCSKLDRMKLTSQWHEVYSSRKATDLVDFLRAMQRR